MIKPEDIEVKVLAWCNWTGYEFLVKVGKRETRINNDYAFNRWVWKRSGSIRRPSFKKINDYLKTIEGKQATFCALWDYLDGYNKSNNTDYNLTTFYGLVSND